MGRRIDAVEGIAISARAIGDPVDALAAAGGPYGPSEGWRPPQDDSFVEIDSCYFAFRISVSKSGLDSSRTKWGYFSPPV